MNSHPATKKKFVCRFFPSPFLSVACKLAPLHRFVDHVDTRNEILKRESLLSWSNFTGLQTNINSLMRNDSWLQRWHIIGPGKFSLVDKGTASHVNNPTSHLPLAQRSLRWELYHSTFVIYKPRILRIPYTFHLLPCRNKGTGSVTLWSGPSLRVVAVKHVVVISWGKLQYSFFCQWTGSTVMVVSAEYTE